jgi:branched-chain amino acid transport system substrate-binding protein
MNTRRKILVLLCAITVAFSWGYSAGEAVAAEPIKIGAFFDLSGPASFIGTPTKLVATMVVEKINKEGGINGRPLELVIGDTEGDPTRALMVAKRLVENEKHWSHPHRHRHGSEEIPGRQTDTHGHDGGR